VSLSDFVDLGTFTYKISDSAVQPAAHHAIWYSLLLLGYKPVRHIIVRNIVGDGNIMVNIIIL